MATFRAAPNNGVHLSVDKTESYKANDCDRRWMVPHNMENSCFTRRALISITWK